MPSDSDMYRPAQALLLMGFTVMIAVVTITIMDIAA